MMKKTCFVVMPIRESGSQEHKHFSIIYQQFFAPVLQSSGYESVRADEISKSGLITKDIVRQLSVADLVLADLTDFNPNVFYELGIRHSLRRFGTLLVLDKSRNQKIPFDLSPYRYIAFESTLEGLQGFQDALRKAISECERQDLEARDNPVHDFIPELPNDLLTAGPGPLTSLSEENARIKEIVRTYERKFGRLDADAERANVDPFAVFEAAVSEATSGKLPQDIVQEAVKAAEIGDVAGFVHGVSKLRDSRLFAPAPVDLIRLAQWADRLGSSQVARAILDLALKHHPSDGNIVRIRLSKMSESPDPRERAAARDEIYRRVGIKIEHDNSGQSFVVELTREIDTTETLVLFDALQYDGLGREALAISTELLKHHADSITLRNHARALESVGRANEALTWFRKVIFADNASDVAVGWYGNTLHNRRDHRAALECFLLASTYDQEDAQYYLNIADEILSIRKNRTIQGKGISAALPSEMNEEFVLDLCAVGARYARSQESLAELRRLLSRMSVVPGPAEFDRRVNELDEADVRNRIVSFYERLKSPVTVEAANVH